MIKPLTTVTAVVSSAGLEISLADSENAPNRGKNALGSLLKGEDIHAPGGEANIIPFHAVDYATVAHSSTEEEDPVDDLCKPEEDEGILGFWKFNDTLTLPEMGTEWTLDFSVAGTNANAIKAERLEEQGFTADTLQFCFAGMGCEPVYADMGESTAWAIPTAQTVKILGGADSTNPEFTAWLEANAVKIYPKTLSGTWRFILDPSFEGIPYKVNQAPMQFTSNGKTYSTLEVNPLVPYISYQGSSGGKTVYPNPEVQEPREWTDDAYRTVVFPAEVVVPDEIYSWFIVNATQVN